MFTIEPRVAWQPWKLRSSPPVGRHPERIHKDGVLHSAATATTATSSAAAATAAAVAALEPVRLFIRFCQKPRTELLWKIQCVETLVFIYCI